MEALHYLYVNSVDVGYQVIFRLLTVFVSSLHEQKVSLFELELQGSALLLTKAINKLDSKKNIDTAQVTPVLCFC